MTLWIQGYIDRNAVITALVNSGYTIKAVERPNKEWPLTHKDFGIEIIEEPS